MNRRIAFGIDLSGYVAAKTVCAAAVVSGDRVEVAILLKCPFSKRREANEDLTPIVDEEVGFLCKLMKLGQVAVDVPIDLQGLPGGVDATNVWQLTLRPIDKFFGALPALADKIGAPTARFQNIMKADGFRINLGNRLFETYPAASLQRLGLRHQRYKGNKPEAVANRQALSRDFNIDPETLTDDEFDATICAVTALATPPARLEGSDLGGMLSAKFPAQLARPPEGYVLLQSNPYSRIAVTRVSAAEWLEDHA